MIPKECKRLAEVDFPVAEVSRHSTREKSIRHGHPSTLHLWWARRPLAACRGVRGVDLSRVHPGAGRDLRLFVSSGVRRIEPHRLQVCPFSVPARRNRDLLAVAGFPDPRLRLPHRSPSSGLRKRSPAPGCACPVRCPRLRGSPSSLVGLEVTGGPHAPRE